MYITQKAESKTWLLNQLAIYILQTSPIAKAINCGMYKNESKFEKILKTFFNKKMQLLLVHLEHVIIIYQLKVDVDMGKYLERKKLCSLQSTQNRRWIPLHIEV